MSTETDVLILAQWLSPGFPVGAFAYSHGLEQAIHDGAVTDATTLRAWLTDILAAGSARADAVLLAAAQAATTPARVAEIDALARAFAASAERLRESAQAGAAFAATVRAVWGLDFSDLLYPVAVGRAAGLRGLDAQLTAALYLQSFAANLTSAAVRAIPLGQTEGQSVIAALAPLCAATAAEAQDTDLQGLWSNGFASDVAQMRHETLQPRLFQS